MQYDESPSEQTSRIVGVNSSNWRITAIAIVITAVFVLFIICAYYTGVSIFDDSPPTSNPPFELGAIEKQRQANKMLSQERELLVDLDTNYCNPPCFGMPMVINLAITTKVKSDNLLEITARVGKHPSVKKIIFDNISVHIELPPGLELQSGTLSWNGYLQNNEFKHFQAIVKATKVTEIGWEVIMAYATANIRGENFDKATDDELIYIRSRGKRIEISDKAFDVSGLGEAQRLR